MGAITVLVIPAIKENSAYTETLCLLEVVRTFLIIIDSLHKECSLVQSGEGIKNVNIKKHTLLKSIFTLVEMYIAKQNDLRISNYAFKMSRKFATELKSEYNILGFVILFILNRKKVFGKNAVILSCFVFIHIWYENTLCHSQDHS